MSISDPDWERYQVTSRAGDSTGKNHTPLGDPTRWGARVEQIVDPASVALQQLVANQILRVQCADNYSRPWALVGTITADRQLWDTPPDNPAGLNEWTSSIDVFMGAGQNTLVHRVNLRAVIDADAPFYFDTDKIFAGPDPAFRTRPFVMPGGLIGNALSITVRNFVLLQAPLVSLTPIVVNLQVTPFNAGTGL